MEEDLALTHLVSGCQAENHLGFSLQVLAVRRHVELRLGLFRQRNFDGIFRGSCHRLLLLFLDFLQYRRRDAWFFCAFFDRTVIGSEASPNFLLL